MGQGTGWKQMLVTSDDSPKLNRSGPVCVEVKPQAVGSVLPVLHVCESIQLHLWIYGAILKSGPTFAF